MGFFGNFFGKLFGKETADIEQEQTQSPVVMGRTAEKKIETPVVRAVEKTSEKLDEATFWNLVDQSLQNTDNQEDQELYLRREIEKLTPKEIIGFQLRMDQLSYDLYNSTVWCAAFLMNGGCSDDAFDYFRSWVISRGQVVYCQAKENPDTLISQKNHAAEEDEIFDFEGFGYVALDAFAAKTGEDLFDYIDENAFNSMEEHLLDIAFDWDEEDPESMRTLCPQLFQHFWE